MNGWAQRPLAELLSEPLRNGRSVPTAADGFPVLRLTAIKRGSIDLDERKTGAWTAADAQACLVAAGDFMIARGNGSLALVGRGGLVRTEPDQVAFPDTMIRARPDPSRLVAEYLALVWESQGVRRQIERSARTSAGIYKVSQSSLAAVRLSVPSVAEQRRVVAILEEHLSDLDDADRSLQDAAARLERLTTALLWSATHGLAGSTSVTLDEIAEVRLGRQRSPKNHTGPRMRPYLRAANVDWDRLRLDDVAEMNFSASEEDVYKLVPGDILLAEASGSAAEVGKSALYSGVPSNVCFQNTLLRVRCHHAEPEFIQKYLLAEARAGRFMPEARGVGINHLGRARLASLVVDLPPETLQRETAQRVTELLQQVARTKALTERQGVRGKSLRSAILTAAFSGRLTGHRHDNDVIEELAEEESA